MSFGLLHKMNSPTNRSLWSSRESYEF